MSLVNNSANNFKDFLDAIKPYLNYQMYDLSGQGVEANNFSTDEKVIGTWTDGKPLYQKTFIFTNYTLTALDSWRFLVDVPDLHISNSCCFITNSYCVASAGNFTNISQIATMSGGSNAYTKSFTIAFDSRHLTSEFSANDCLNIITSIALSNVTLVFTLRYTKTTDTAVSSGEKIVGQWIDGKPLFEKSGTFTESDFESGRVQTWNYFDLLGLIDASTIIDISGIILTSNYGVAPIGTPKTVAAEPSYYFGSYFNYKKRIVIDNHLPAGSVTDFKLNITVRYTKTA